MLGCSVSHRFPDCSSGASLRRHLKPTNDSWRVDETYIRVKGKLRLPVSCGGFFRRDPRLSPLGQAGRGRSKALSGQSVGTARTIPCRESSTPTSVPLTRRRLCISKTTMFWRRTANTDRCSTSITCWNRITGPSNVESTRVSIFAPSGGAWRTIAGYEAIHMIRKGQACWSAMGTGSGLLHHFVLGMFGIEV
jgi:transposase, IS6 family